MLIVLTLFLQLPLAALMRQAKGMLQKFWKTPQRKEPEHGKQYPGSMAKALIYTIANGATH